MFSETEPIIIFFIAGTVFTLVLISFFFLYMFTHQHKLHKFNIALKEKELQKQQEIFQAIQDGEEKERKRLAEELHDGIGAKLSGLKMSLEYLKENQHSDNSNLIEKVYSGISETVDELREVSRNLQPSYMASKGLTQAIDELIQNLNHPKKCSFNAFIDLKENTDIKLQTNIYRIVSELLNNVNRHSSASEASAQVLSNDDNIQIIVEDNGKGFRNDHMNGIGLLNIKNRVALLDGKINIDSGERGSTFIIDLPNTVL